LTRTVIYAPRLHHIISVFVCLPRLTWRCDGVGCRSTVRRLLPSESSSTLASEVMHSTRQRCDPLEQSC